MKQILSIIPMLSLLLGGVGLFLSLWIVLPAPTAFLLPLSVGAPEISPWLMLGNAIAVLFALSSRAFPMWRIAVALSILGLILSSWPLLRLPATVRRTTAEFQQQLGIASDLLPQLVQSPLRSQPFSLVDTFLGIPSPAVYRSEAIPFATPEGIPLHLAIYRPLRGGNNPAIVTIYGGSWQRGSPSDHEAFNRYMAGRGYTAISIDYRHAPEYRFPTQLEDVQTAIAWIRDRAAEYRVDTDRIAVLGRSAGAQLAMLLAYSPETPPLRAVVSYYGPIDLANGYRHPPFPDPIGTRRVLETFLGGSPAQFPSLYRQASPIHLVKENLPPTLLVYGSRDRVVEARYARGLAEQLHAAGNRAALIEIPWADHAFDTVFNGVSSQLSLYYTERFLAWALRDAEPPSPG
ncbi:alpha/beta hydrolase [Synechococcus sp. PCC 7336]|uniref:alpha/beta hydrolase n=1 Tax=Synechococcus sp. PCC 7336 TaxID=195250 RepID=UPI0003487E7C|nr:alpha/beta hydrolase [Synechococcus sp. PCC 7336]